MVVHPDEVDAGPQKFGAGRKKGSRNRTSDDRARLVLQIAGDPVLALARIAAMDLAQIKTMLGCDRMEAFQVWRSALLDIAPYVAAKLPLAVTVSGKVTTLNIGVPLSDGGLALGPEGIMAMFLQHGGAQVIEQTPEPENDDKSDG